MGERKEGGLVAGEKGCGHSTCRWQERSSAERLSIGPSVHRSIRPSGHRSISPSGHQAIGPSDRRSISSLRHFLFSLLVSVDGGWSAWQAWSACSVTCMGIGVRGRIRDCDNPVPLHGGSNCSGSFGETETCDNSFVLCSRERLAFSYPCRNSRPPSANPAATLSPSFS